MSVLSNGVGHRNGAANGRLRVCHLGKFYPPASGGMETHVRTLAQAQAEEGAEVRVLCVNHLDRRGRDVTWEALSASETVEDWDGPVRVNRLGKRASLVRLEFCLGLPGLLHRLQKTGADVLHLHVPIPTMLLALAAVGSRLPLVITYHSDVIRQKTLGLLLRPFEHLVFGKAAALFATSPAYPAGSSLLQQYRRKVAVLPFGIDLEPYRNPTAGSLKFARDLVAEHGQPLWLAVGRLVYYKGLHNAITALRSVPGKLVVVGVGPLEGELRQRAAEAGVADRILWHNRLEHEELIGAYHAATALWFPSNARSEAFGLVQAEAMACGCPVINSAIPGSGVPWVSRHEESGLTVAVDDASALAAASNRLLSEEGLRDRLSRGARERAGRDFDHRLMARRSLEYYQQALRGEGVRVHVA
jgi:rhamnosyl/mannosyltransferase